MAGVAPRAAWQTASPASLPELRAKEMPSPELGDMMPAASPASSARPCPATMSAGVLTWMATPPSRRTVCPRG